MVQKGQEGGNIDKTPPVILARLDEQLRKDAEKDND
jgi:hypothetical protein